MTNLTRFDSDGLELVIDTVTGYATMAEKAKSTISERVLTVRNDLVKSSEMLTSTGLKTVRLIPAELVYVIYS